ncbi:MAG: sarcosine oxidase subunit gamma family protein [Alphaproteobacteria bacterium]|nr:sarcosine oxidase subunit gamma family protein [Alphaproteobacteria bacterium]
MADIQTPPRRSALEGHYQSGDFGWVADDAPGIVMTERRGLAIVHIDAWAERQGEVQHALRQDFDITPPEALRGVEVGQRAILWVGPRRWLVVEKETRDLHAAIGRSIPTDWAAITDQGHSRVCWRLEGPALRSVLAKGSTIDFDAFGDGDCVGTMLGHFTVTVFGRGATGADIFCARSFAPDLHHWLVDASLEYGLRITDPA